MTDENEESPTVKFVASWSSFNKHLWVDKRQKGGRWAPAFPPASVKDEEEYIEKMIARDKEAGYY